MELEEIGGMVRGFEEVVGIDVLNEIRGKNDN